MTEDIACSFCGKGPTEVRRLVKGPGVAICDGCVRVCYEIIEGLDGDGAAQTEQQPATDDVMVAITRAQQYHATPAVRGFYASLYLNLAQDYAKLGREDQAREHLERAERATTDLPADGYGDLVRSGISALRERLSTSDT